MNATQPNKPEKRSRSFLTFRLKSALVFVVLLSISVFYYQKVNIGALEQKKAVAWVKENQGRFLYDFQIGADGQPNDLEYPEHIPAILYQKFGIDFFCNVVELDFGFQKLETIQPIVGLKNLKKLNLRSTKIEDISPIEELEKLAEIDLTGLKLQSFDPLLKCKKLKKLTLWGTNIQDVKTISKIKTLEYLHIGHTGIKNFKPLSALPLKSLYAANCNISDLSVLPDLPYLQELGLWENPISDLTPISKWPNLKLLNLNQIETVVDIKPLADLKKMQILYMQGTKIKDISPLKNLTDMTFVVLPVTVQNYSPISNWTKLERLAYSTRIKGDMAMLKKLTKLKVLEINGDSYNYHYLANLKEMESLRISNCDFHDLSLLKDATKLKKLELFSTEISNLSPIGNMSQLEELYIVGFRGKDFTPLTKLKKLQRANLYAENITSKDFADLGKALPKTIFDGNLQAMFEADKKFGTKLFNRQLSPRIIRSTFQPKIR